MAGVLPASLLAQTDFPAPVLHEMVESESNRHLSRFARLQQLYEQAQQLLPAHREHFVRQQAGADPALVQEVLQLLRPRPTLETAGLVEAVAATVKTADSLPQMVGPYQILSLLGQGGMGVVYRASRPELRHPVAVKVCQGVLGHVPEEAFVRFQVERRALAAMNHRYIARMYDVGTTERGEPYFVMELVEGASLTQHCDQRRLGIAARLNLFQQVCEGVQHAHDRFVVHRDLKPANVLVVDEGGEDVPKILDFGVARLLDPEVVRERLRLTRDGRRIGTPLYFSPEQALGKGDAIDVRTDVYSLGVMLYELLTGELPFLESQLQEIERQEGSVAMYRFLATQEPERPSSRLTGIGPAAVGAALRSLTPAVLRRTLLGDLDCIVMKAMAKDPARRYASAIAFAEDLGRYLQHEPVIAKQPTVGYQLRKFVRRHRGAVAAGLAILFTCIVGAIAVLVEKARADSTVRNFDMLAGVVLHRKIVAAEAGLYPALPAHIESMQGWLADVDRLLAARVDIEHTLRLLLVGRGAEGGEQGESERFLSDALRGLVLNLDLLERRQKPQVVRRLEWAAQLDSLTRHHPNAHHSWDEVAAAIKKSPTYAGQDLDLRLEHVLGLVPIGENPRTHFWEFYDLRSAWDGATPPQDLAIPVHESDGAISMSAATGIVFVLLPGGKVRLGARTAVHGPERRDEETEPLHDVVLAPFFLARHELTQEQWSRLWTWDDAHLAPSRYQAGASDFLGGRIGAAHPVEQVSWLMCKQLLERSGMVLPTEAQWEYGCRAGTTTDWWPGAVATDLRGCCNLLDLSAAGRGWGTPEPFDDGHQVHAAVGSFAANPFGLYDTHGNVSEWCLDLHGPYGTEVVGTGLRAAEQDAPAYYCARGGAFSDHAASVRSTSRRHHEAGIRHNNLGVRPARSLVP